MSSPINIKLECPKCRGDGTDYYILIPADIMLDHGAPSCPTHGESLWTDEDFALAKEIRAKLTEPVNICQFIALSGGMRPTPDLLQILARHHYQLSTSWIKGGKGRLTTHKAQWSVAGAMEAAIEAGYFNDDIIEADFYEAIDETLGGNLTYSMRDAGDAGLYEHDARISII